MAGAQTFCLAFFSLSSAPGVGATICYVEVCLTPQEHPGAISGRNVGRGLCAEKKAFTFRTLFSCLVICGGGVEAGFLYVARGGLELTM